MKSKLKWIFLFLLQFLFINIVYSQSQKNNAYKRSGYLEKHKKVERNYELRLKRKLSCTDTILTNGKMTIRYFAKNNLKLKDIEYSLTREGCKQYAWENFYNKRGLIAYSRHHGMTCIKLAEGEYDFHPLQFRRYKYDRKGNLTSIIYDEGGMPKKYLFYKDEYGNQQYHYMKIRQVDFWK
ncbi:hypothetical protein [Pedobacter sp. UBA5917]|jgi:hypothetical protein|uniref:hypothetical protein n=1 Tax=Pedobacter sp. UBA5917 TaxID=1947061 RepID=UPI0025E2178C|nr:hypothetical protein [Pedobacter sp. UBA5917]